MKRRYWILIFMVAMLLLIIDLALPDPIPIIDELLLGLANILIGKKVFLKK